MDCGKLGEYKYSMRALGSKSRLFLAMSVLPVAVVTTNPGEEE